VPDIVKLLRGKKWLGAQGLKGLRQKEHLLPLFDNTNERLHHLVIKHCLPSSRGCNINTLALAETDSYSGYWWGCSPDKLVDFQAGHQVPDVRPIITGDAFGRLTGSLFLRIISGQLGKWFQESVLNARQYAVGVKDGNAKAVHAVRMLMEAGLEDADPLDPCAVISTDISNAFNEVGRDVIFQILLDAADSEGPWMDDLPAGQDLPVPPLLRKYFTHFIDTMAHT